MFSNYLATALRNLARNWLYAAISILGLAVAFASAILIAQFVRNEFSFNRWIPDYEHLYKITDNLEQPGQPPSPSDITTAGIAKRLELALPTVNTSRIMQDFPTLRYKANEEGIVDQSFVWADPDIFSVLQLPALSGDLKTALDQPDTVVITRAIARKYFGRDLPVGETLDVQQGTDHHPMRVTAILKDLPPNTTLVAEVFASARSAYAPFIRIDQHPPLTGITNQTFVRVPANMSAADLQKGLDEAGKPETEAFGRLGGVKFQFYALPMAEVHMVDPGLTDIVVKPTGSRGTTLAIGAVAVLIVLVAGINFVTLMTARASRRAVEVGVRKVSGAGRSDLIVQFMGEAIIYVALAMLIAVGLAALLLKPFGAFLQSDLRLDFIGDPALTGSILALTIVIGLLGGLYPAMVLSGFRPAAVLKGGLVQTAGSALARQALVVVQFAILVGLILTTATIYQQTQFALKRGMGAQSDLMMQVWTPCNNAFPDEVRRLPGVTAAACSSLMALNSPSAKQLTGIPTPDGRQTKFDVAPVDFGFFETFNIKPIAGRTFSRDHGGDSALVEVGSTGAPTVIINETAARNLGYTDPGAAVGHQMSWTAPRPPRPPAAPGSPSPPAPPPGPPPMSQSEIIGVVPDMPVTVRSATDPTFYFIFPRASGMLSIQMTGKDIPATVREVERVWKATGNIRPIQEVFLSDYIRKQYRDIIIQGAVIAVCSILAVVIACLGLFALSAYTTERRTKEIGIRKAMGASTIDVVRLLMWQFTVPVLWAIAIALPIGYLLMDQWLRGFVYHVDLSPWIFLIAAAIALVIAWVTVSFQSYVVARAKPVGALRYE